VLIFLLAQLVDRLREKGAWDKVRSVGFEIEEHLAQRDEGGNELEEKVKVALQEVHPRCDLLAGQWSTLAVGRPGAFRPFTGTGSTYRAFSIAFTSLVRAL